MQHCIPCYGDLTPGIPDVVETKSAERLAGFLRNDLGTQSAVASVQCPVPGVQLSVSSSGSGSGSGLFACLRVATGNGQRETGSRQLATVLAVARDFSPRVMTASEREVLVDISGLGRLIGPPDEIARQLAHALFDAGVNANVAIGPTQTIARLLARGAGCEAGGADGIFEPVAAGSRDRASHLASRASLLPVHFLQDLEKLPPAMNERDRLRPYETFQRWGLVTLGDVAALSAAELSSRLGRRGVALQQLARGIDLRPFVPDRETRRFVERLELEWPIDSLEPLSFVLARLLEPLSDALERADRGAVAIRLELRLTDRSTCARVLPLPAPMRDARTLRTLLLLALESTPPPAAIDVVSIELDPAPARIVRYSLLDRALPSPETLATLTARLSALVGESRVGSAVLLDSHAPDAFVVARFAPDGAGGAARAEGAARAGAESAGGAVLRRQRHPPAIRVAVERGRPVHIAASKRGIPYGAIAQAAGPWRTSGGWWGAPGARGWGLSQGVGVGQGAGPVPPKPRRGEGGWNRDEWDVALKSGAVCRIYQDRSTERWFLEGIYD